MVIGTSRKTGTTIRSADALSKNDSTLLLDLIYTSLSCRTEIQLKELINDLKDLVPHDFALCAFGKIQRSPQDAYNVVNVSYPTAWMELYALKGFDKTDPIVVENFVTSEVQYWDDTFRKYASAEAFVQYARDFGLNKGYSYGLKNQKGDKISLFSFAASSMRRHARTEIVLAHIIPHLHQALVRILEERKDPAAVNVPQLSEREKEVLKWAKDGKSTWEISMILSISRDTVKFHIKNIMEKLQAVSRTQAVAIALESGIISID
jgi:LuxR family transcriptional regulator, quorum-sensing system regulator CviR